MLIACIDFSGHGHRLHLMRSIIKTIVEAGHNAICIMDETYPVKKWLDENCIDVDKNIIYYDYKCIIPTELKWNKRFKDIQIALQYWKQYNTVLKKIEKENSLTVDIVVINYIDVFLSCLMPHFLQNLFFDYRWAGLYVHTRYMRMFEHLGVQHKKTKISDIDYLFKSEKCIGIGVFDNGINQALEFRLDKKVTLIPDITDVSTDNKVYPLANEIIKMANGRMVVGSIGMSYYTGTLDLIKLAILCRDSDYFFVFCGMFDEAIYQQIQTAEDKELLKKFRQNPSQNCIWKENYLTDEFEYNAVFKTLDVIYMMYPEHYTSSNRLTKVAFFNKLVLASNKFCVGENVINNELGEVAEPGNIRQQAEKLAVIEEKIKERKTPEARRKEYYLQNNEAVFQIRIKEMLGLEY